MTISVIEPLFLYGGVTIALFRSFGIIQQAINSLNNLVTIGTNFKDAALKIFVEIPVAPVPLELDKLTKRSFTNSFVVGSKVNVFLLFIFIVSDKCLFIKSVQSDDEEVDVEDSVVKKTLKNIFNVGNEDADFNLIDNLNLDNFDLVECKIFN